jgi:hypothetical protein
MEDEIITIDDNESVEFIENKLLSKDDKRQLSEIYFGRLTDLHGVYIKTKTKWICKSCSNEVSCNLCKGIDKLVNHLVGNHKEEYEQKLLDYKAGRKIIFQLTTDKAKHIYGHIDLLMSLNLPFSYVNNYEINALYINLPTISRQTLAKYVVQLSKHVSIQVRSSQQ